MRTKRRALLRVARGEGVDGTTGGRGRRQEMRRRLADGLLTVTRTVDGVARLIEKREFVEEVVLRRSLAGEGQDLGRARCQHFEGGQIAFAESVPLQGAGEDQPDGLAPGEARGAGDDARPEGQPKRA